MTAREEAVHQEIKAAKNEQRLRITVYAGMLLVFVVLVATLVYTVMAANSARDAAEAATAQAKTNAEVLDRIAAGDARRGVILGEVQKANKEEAARFQALLDTLFGKDVATLGEPAPATVRVVPRAASDGRTVATSPPKRTTPPRSAPSPAPRPTPRPTPAPLPVPSVAPVPRLPIPLPIHSALCTSIVCIK